MSAWPSPSCCSRAGGRLQPLNPPDGTLGGSDEVATATAFPAHNTTAAPLCQLPQLCLKSCSDCVLCCCLCWRPLGAPASTGLLADCRLLPVQGRALRDGLVFVAPYDDPYTIAGQGTIGTEILRQLSTLQDDNLHAIFVAIGGGGLIAGIGAYIKALKPHVKVIGVEPTGGRWPGQAAMRRAGQGSTDAVQHAA